MSDLEVLILGIFFDKHLDIEVDVPDSKRYWCMMKLISSAVVYNIITKILVMYSNDLKFNFNSILFKITIL